MNPRALNVSLVYGCRLQYDGLQAGYDLNMRFFDQTAETAWPWALDFFQAEGVGVGSVPVANAELDCPKHLVACLRASLKDYSSCGLAYAF